MDAMCVFSLKKHLSSMSELFELSWLRVLSCLYILRVPCSHTCTHISSTFEANVLALSVQAYSWQSRAEKSNKSFKGK